MSERTRYLLDANVLLYDPEALLAFPDGEVIVPITVIEEIDQFKSEVSETGRNARLVSKAIDRHRQTGSLAAGLQQSNGSTLRVHIWNPDSDGLPKELDLRRSGNRVLGSALQLKKRGGGQVVLGSQDTNIRIKANALGVEAISYEGERPTTTELYAGWELAEVSAAELERSRQNQPPTFSDHFYPNQGLVLQDRDNPRQFLVYRKIEAERELQPVADFSAVIWGITPRNPQQALAMDIMLDPSVSIVTLMGKA